MEPHKIRLIFFLLIFLVSGNSKAQNRLRTDDSTQIAEIKIELEKSNKVKDHFLSNISTQLKTPLDSIINFK